MISEPHERRAQGFFIPSFRAVLQAKGMAEFVGYAPDKNAVEFAQRHFTVFVILQDRLVLANIIQIQNDRIDYETEAIRLCPRAVVRRMVAEGPGRRIPVGQIAKD